MGVHILGFSYDKLWKLLIDKKMKKIDLAREAGIGPNTMSRLSKDQTVQMQILGKICEELNCNIGDIVDYIKNGGEDK